MGLDIVWASNAMVQPTGYGRIASEVLPRLQQQSDHHVAQFCVSGLEHCMVFEHKGVKLYSHSTRAHERLGLDDMPRVHRAVNPDIWMLNFDAWAIGAGLAQMNFPYVLYPPVDHDPLPEKWYSVIARAQEVIPYCQFGERIMAETFADADHFREPIYHGVDTDVFCPDSEATKEALWGQLDGADIDEDTFVVGIFKNNQGVRANYVRQLRAFAMFLEQTGADAYLYIHCAIQGMDAPNLSRWVQKFGLSGRVLRVDQDQYHIGIPDNQLNRAYNACDALLNVVDCEGFGLPILEAAATGTPAIVSGFSSMPELVGAPEGEIRHSDTEDDVVVAPRGFIVPVWDFEFAPRKASYRRTYKTEHIARAIARMHAEWQHEEPGVYGSMCREARRFALQHDWSQVVQEWIEYFDGLEERLFHTDTFGFEWKELATEAQAKGGVGALRGGRDNE